MRRSRSGTLAGRDIACVAGALLIASVLRSADRPPLVRQPFVPNLLANARLESAVAGEDLPVPQWFSVVAASLSTPVVLRTAIPHGLASGDVAVIRGVPAGNAPVDGVWRVHAVSATDLALEGSAATGIFSGGGAIFPTAGQPLPPGPGNGSGDLLWTPWHSTPARIAPREFFLAGGAEPTGEVTTLPVSPGDALIAQEVDATLLTPGERLWLSIECRMPDRPLGAQRLRLTVTAFLTTTRTYEVSFAASDIGPTYQRFAMVFALDPLPIPAGGFLRVEFRNEVTSGPSAVMLWTRPMLSAGDALAPWTGNVPRLPRTHGFYAPPPS